LFRIIRNHIFRSSILLVALLLISGAAFAGLVHTDSDAEYLHRVNLFNSEGEIILPDSDPPQPYDPNRTCGKCHNYPVISYGWHFNPHVEEVDPGRPGEPHFLTDELTHTQLPLSYRNWPGVFSPNDIGLSPWEYTLMFTTHRPGGGISEPNEDEIESASKGSRWLQSGPLAIDCLVCHAGSGYDSIVRARQINEQNLKCSMTAAAGLAVVRGSAKGMPEDYDPFFSEPDPDHPEEAGPKLLYSAGRFDADNRVFIDITKKPKSTNCRFCHTTASLDEDGHSKWSHDDDVHLLSGLSCVDCHRNEIGHHITRGDGSEADINNEDSNATLSCRGCHLGEGEGHRPLAGRLGAPRPAHPGLPGFHLDELECTTCHSGPRPGPKALRIQTAIAHGLGISTEDDRSIKAPYIAAPVYMKNSNGKIAPHKVMWPSYWGIVKADKSIAPIPMKQLKAIAESVFKEIAKENKESETPVLTKEQINKVLAALDESGKLSGKAVYVNAGSAYSSEGKLPPDNNLKREIAWPLAHNVRPAGYSLGSGGCSDCHSKDSGFFYGSVDPGGNTTAAMHQYMGISKLALVLGNVAVYMREGMVAQVIALLALAVVILSLLHYTLVAKRVKNVTVVCSTLPWPRAWLSWLGSAGLAVLSATGVGFLLTYGPAKLGFFSSHIAVEAHIAAGIVFSIACVFLMMGFLTGSKTWSSCCGLLWSCCEGKKRAMLVWLDILIFGCMALTGLVLALRHYDIEASALILTLSYTLHGIVAMLAVARLALYIYFRSLLAGKAE
jgi:hypothetical protein